MADLENEMPDIESMDDKAFDALKSDMMAGKDVSVKAEQVADPALTDAEAPIVADDDDADEPIIAADENGQPQKQTSVPFERFDKTRHQLKEERAARATEKAEFEARDKQRQDRLDDILKSFAQPKQAEPEPVAIPDLETNPVGMIGHTAAEVAAIKKTLEERTQREETTRQQQEVFNWSQQEFAKAIQADPTVADAYKEVYASFRQEAEEVYGLEGQALADHLAETERSHIYFALQNKKPLGQFVKTLAKMRAKWDGSPKPAANANPAPNAAALQQEITDKEQILRSAASIGNAGGSPARTGMPSPQELLDMSPSQYDAWRAKNDIRKAFAA